MARKSTTTEALPLDGAESAADALPLPAADDPPADTFASDGLNDRQRAELAAARAAIADALAGVDNAHHLADETRRDQRRVEAALVQAEADFMAARSQATLARLESARAAVPVAEEAVRIADRAIDAARERVAMARAEEQATKDRHAIEHAQDDVDALAPGATWQAFVGRCRPHLDAAVIGLRAVAASVPALIAAVEEHNQHVQRFLLACTAARLRFFPDHHTATPSEAHALFVASAMRCDASAIISALSKLAIVPPRFPTENNLWAFINVILGLTRYPGDPISPATIDEFLTLGPREMHAVAARRKEEEEKKHRAWMHAMLNTPRKAVGA